MLVVCERWVRDGDRLLHIDPKFFWPWQHFFLILAWVAQPWVTEGRKALSPQAVLTLTSCPWLTPTPTGTDSDRLCTWLYNCLHPPASAFFPLINTGESLDWRLGRGSICYSNQPTKLPSQNQHLLFCCVLSIFCSNVASPYDVVLCCCLMRFSFSFKVSLS